MNWNLDLDKTWSFADISSCCAEIVSITNNIMSDVHAGGTWLVDENTLIQSS